MRNYTSLVNQNNFWEGLREMESISPVWTEAEKHLEREIAKNQPEFSAIIGLPVTLEIIDKDDHSKRSYLQDYSISVRFRLSPEEREAVAAGKDLVVTQLLFGNRFTPINLQFCSEGEKPTVDVVLPKLPPPAAIAQADGDPSAADLDVAVKEGTAEVIEFPNQTEQPEPAGDQPQSEV